MLKNTPLFVSNTSKMFIVAFILTLSNVASAWEQYEFDVTSINAIKSSTAICVIGVSNSVKTLGNDGNICDNPTRIEISNCDSEQATTIMALMMAAKLSDKRALHQVIGQKSASPCVHYGYNLGLAAD